MNSLSKMSETKQLSNLLLEKIISKLMIFQLIKKFPAFYEIRMYISVFSKTYHSTVSWASLILFTHQYSEKADTDFLLPYIL
jgi:hypothetical protein